MYAPEPLARVLVAEDDRSVRDSLARVLRFEGYEVDAVNDGAEALEAVTRQLPDVVVMDVMMPNVDGLTACRMMRDRHPALPILMLKARHEVADRVAGLAAGPDDSRVRPFAHREPLPRPESLAGRVELGWTITGGRVTDVVLVGNSSGNAEFGACMVRAMRSVRFPAELNAEVDRFPWVFSGR